MGTRALRLAAFVAILIPVAGCGGGDEYDPWADWPNADAEDHVPSPPDITIATPSIDGRYVTTAAGVHIAGTTSDPDARIEWTSSAGIVGNTDPEYEFCFDCRYDWAIEVALQMGENTIRVVAINDDGTGLATIRIIRQDPRQQWAWAR